MISRLASYFRNINPRRREKGSRKKTKLSTRSGREEDVLQRTTKEDQG